MHVKWSLLEKQLVHFLVAFVSVLVPQLVAVNGHVTRDLVTSVVSGAAVAAYHTAFPGGTAEVVADAKADVSGK